MRYEKYILIYFLFFSLLQESFVLSQARLVFGATATYVNISNGAYLVVGDNTASAATNTIDRTSGAGWIISEGAGGTANRVKWYIGNAAAGTYTIPFGRSTTTYIPVILTIGLAGTTGGSFVFSTYETTNCTNSAYLPTLGTNPPTVYDCSGFGDASNYGIDRFWEIDASGYGASKPNLSALRFYYSDAEVTGITCSNTGMVESNLKAQRWNNTTTDWEAYLFLKGTDTPASNYVDMSGAAVVSGTNDLAKSQWWTLIDNAKPLPVEWLSMSAECVQASKKGVNVKWSTATEQNSDFFSVERSLDAINYNVTATVKAAGNSGTVKNYSFIDSDVFAKTVYYRIRETSFNGASTLSKEVSADGCFSNNIHIYGSVGGIIVTIDALQEGTCLVEMTDALGKKLLSKQISFDAGNSQTKLYVSDIASALYFVKIYTAQNTSAEKVFIQSTTY